jgi:hypothetical protein
VHARHRGRGGLTGGEWGLFQRKQGWGSAPDPAKGNAFGNHLLKDGG